MNRSRAYNQYVIRAVENGFIVEAGYSRGDVCDRYVFETFDALTIWLRKATEAEQRERESGND